MRKCINDGAVSPDQDEDLAMSYLQRAHGWLKHVDTQASSAIHDLERALEINLDLKAQIDPLLRLARRHHKS